MKTKILLTLLAGFSLTFASCTPTQKGAVVGGGVGAATGAAIGSGSGNAGRGAFIGGALGTGAGALIGGRNENNRH